MRIFFGTADIAGYFSSVAGELRKRNHEVSLFTISPTAFGYKDDGNAGVAKLVTGMCQWAAAWRGRSIIHKIAWKVTTLVGRAMAFVWALLRADCLVFGFGTSLLPWHLDLPLYRLLRKRIVFVCFGSDSRPSYLDYGGVRDASGDLRPAEYVERATRRCAARVRRLDRWADWVIDNPFSGHFHRRRIINWFAVGMPVRKPVSVLPEPAGLEMSALHAPSVSLVKGTPRINEAIENVRTRVPGLRLIKISGRPNTEVLDALHNCHFVVDQLYSDTPSAGFATEAAACGRPAIVGGYGWSDEWLVMSGLPEWPSLVCRDSELESAIMAMATDADLRRKYAEAASRLASEWSAEKVAGRLTQVLEGQVPESWFCDAAQMPVFYSGGGLDESTARQAMRKLVEFAGEKALCLEHSPRLKAMALQFMGG